MSVRRDLERCLEILEKISKRPDCVEITGYDRVAVESFMYGLERAIKRYEHEAKRIRKYYP